MLFSIVAAPICIPTSSGLGFPFLHNLSSICFFVYDGHYHWYEEVSYCGFKLHLMTSEAEHHFICLWALCMSSLEKCLFKSFAHFFIGLFVFLEWSHVSSLYIVEIKPLSEVSLANMFSHMVGSLSILLMFSLAMQKLFSLM